MKTAAVALALSSALVAVAAPHPQPVAEIDTGFFTVPAQRNPNFHRNGPAALLKAYAKYNIKPPHYLVKAVQRLALHKRQDGNVPAKDQPQDVEYLCPVQVGDQTLQLDFDTGSSDLWVMSDLMSSSSGGSSTNSKAATADHTQYKCKAKVGGGSASRFRRSYNDGIFWRRDNGTNPFSGSTWQISYGDGSTASGKVAADTVTLGGIAVSQQAVECAEQASDEFLQSPGDGLLGLAFSSINTVKPKAVKTWFDNAIEQNKLGKKAFVVDLQHNKDGSYTFGKTLDGDANATKVDNSQGFWQFTADKGYYIGDKHFDDKAPNGAIADTGTTLLLMSDDVAKNYYSGVKDAKMDQQQGGYTFPCSSQLPDITINLGDSWAVVPGSLINFAPVQEGSSTCFGGLQGMGGIGGSDGGSGSGSAPGIGSVPHTKRQGQGIPYIYGDVFLKAVMAEFNNDGPKFAWQAKPVNGGKQ
jgi:hypothetical protein